MVKISFSHYIEISSSTLIKGLNSLKTLRKNLREYLSDLSTWADSFNKHTYFDWKER